MSLKNPVTPPRIDPGTVRLVAQRLNHYATPGPRIKAHNVLYCVSYALYILYIYTYITYTIYGPPLPEDKTHPYTETRLQAAKCV